jgi:P4 family phage/plasmid primase-like protien
MPKLKKQITRRAIANRNRPAAATPLVKNARNRHGSTRNHHVGNAMPGLQIITNGNSNVDVGVLTEPLAPASSTQPNGGGQVITPASPLNLRFAQKFPAVVAKYGDAFHIQQTNSGDKLAGVSESCLAATLGIEANPDAPVVYVTRERLFLRYIPATGIFQKIERPALIALSRTILRDCADYFKCSIDRQPLKFSLATTAKMNGVVETAKSVLAVDDFFGSDSSQFLALNNGMLRLADRKLLPFSPNYRCRTKLAVDYVPGKKCPRFLNNVLKPVLSAANLNLLIRYFGLLLLGKNLAQVLVIMIGEGGEGKGVVVRVVTGILGEGNVASLRAPHLTGRFELGRLADRTSLYGADVPRNFLNNASAPALKSWIGGDPMTGELKHSNAQTPIKGTFNVWLTCNGRPIIRLDGDVKAWRRRLIVVPFNAPSHDNPIPDLSEQILRDEASGVLNLMLDGLDQLRAADCRLEINQEQARVVDDLLLESESHVAFVQEHLRKDPSCKLTVTDCYDRYLEFCSGRQWIPLSRNKFGELIANAVYKTFGLTLRHDVPGRDGKAQRGWKGVASK